MDCIEWEHYKDKNGYGLVRLGGTCKRAHRVVFEKTHGYLPKMVLHICDNPSCINPEHLQAGDQRENMLQMYKRGRRHSGGSEILTEKQREEIKNAPYSYRLRQLLSKKYGVSKTMITNIRRSNVCSTSSHK